MDPREQLAVIIPALTAIVDRIEPTDLDSPTPCANFTVQGVLDHMIGVAATFVPAFRGEAKIEAPESDTTEGEVPTAAFHRGMAGLLDAVNSPGAMGKTPRDQTTTRKLTTMRIAKQDIPVKFDVPGAVARQLPDFGDSTGFGTIDQASAFGWSEPAQHVGRRDTDDRSQHIRQEPVPENACSIEQLASLVRQDAQPTRHCTGRYRGQRTSGAELGQTCHLAHEQRVAAGATMEPRGLSAGSLRVHDPCDQFLDTIDGQALEVHVAGMGTERSDPRRGLVAELIVTVRADDQ